jgi:hypothetical protein
MLANDFTADVVIAEVAASFLVMVVAVEESHLMHFFLSCVAMSIF